MQECLWLGGHGHRAIVAAAPQSELLKRARKQGLETVPVPFRGSLNPRATMALFQAVRGEKVDCIHTHSSSDSWAVYPLHLLGWPVLRSRNITLPIGSRGRGFIYRKGCRRIIATAGVIAEQLQKEAGVDSTRIEVIGEGVELERYHPAERSLEFRRDLGVAGQTLLFGLVGMLRGEKGHLDFVEAAFETVQACPEARFVIVGEGVPGSKVEARIRRKLRERYGEERNGPVLLAGFRDDIPTVMSDLDVLVVPSRAEAWSRVVPQAFAAGRPVIASRVGGLPELVRDGETGLLVDPGEPKQLAQAMQRLATDPDLRQRLARAGRAFAEARLDLHMMMRKTLDLYLEMVQR